MRYKFQKKSRGVREGVDICHALLNVPRDVSVADSPKPPGGLRM